MRDVNTVAQWFSSRFHLNGTDGNGNRPEVRVDDAAEGARAFNPGADHPRGLLEFGQYEGQWLDTPGVIAHEYTHLVVFDLQESHGGGSAYRARIDAEKQRAIDRLNQANEDHLDETNPAAYNRRLAEINALNDRTDQVDLNGSAVNEAMSDIFAAAQTRSWHLELAESDRDAQSGSGILTSQDRQHSTMDSHALGGVLTNAAARIQHELGWNAMEDIFWGAIHNTTFTETSGFSDVARMATLEAARHGGAAAAKAVEAAFAENGVTFTENYAVELGMTTTG